MAFPLWRLCLIAHTFHTMESHTAESHTTESHTMESQGSSSLWPLSYGFCAHFTNPMGMQTTEHHQASLPYLPPTHNYSHHLDHSL